jgi:DNA-binding NtrC family response regulator
VKVNCAALPSELLESEMFGHERGAFTGAESATMGKFEAANHGTLMLDEIGEMPASLQAKLLHVLEDGHVARVGSNDPIQLDVRVIAATNQSVPEMIASGRFREDLYYRLQVIEIEVPPLRDRREEIPTLASEMLGAFAVREGREAIPVSAATMEALVAYDWPGNVRELENVMQRYVILADEEMLVRELMRGRVPAPAAAALAAEPAIVPAPAGGLLHEFGTLPDLARRATIRVEREMIGRVLAIVRWNRRRAARMLGVSYKTLLNKMKALGLDADAPASALPDLQS